MTLAFWRSVGQAFCRLFLSWGLSDGSLVIGVRLWICRQNPTEAVSLLITSYQDVRDDPHIASAVTCTSLLLQKLLTVCLLLCSVDAGH